LAVFAGAGSTTCPSYATPPIFVVSTSAARRNLPKDRDPGFTKTGTAIGFHLQFSANGQQSATIPACRRVRIDGHPGTSCVSINAQADFDCPYRPNLAIFHWLRR
jgi:hypothetical protein